MADKHSIAQLLSQHAERWNSPAEIKTEIADVPDRTLRRWLGELVREGIIERSGSRKGTRYRWKPVAKEEQRQPAVVAGTNAGRSTTQVQSVFSPESEQLLKRSVQVVGFDEIAALYRSLRRALVADLVRSLVPPAEVMGFIESHITDQVQPQHRDKFTQDVVAELNHLNISRMGGLGITREQLAAWLNLRSP